jgi:hypothetical protein
MNRYGLTDREKAIWPPKKELDTFSFMKKCFWFALFAVLLATLIHFTVEPKGTPIVKEHVVGYESDKELCARAATGTRVVGGTASQLVSYCLAHG